MVNNCSHIKLTEICDSIDYGHTASASSMPVGPKFLRITDIVKGFISWDEVPYCDVDERTMRKYRLNDGDIVIARTGANTGTSAYISNPPKAVFASYLIRLKVGSRANPRFISYFLKSPEFWSYMQGVLGDKSAQPNASARTMTQAQLCLPTITEQRAIAHILGTLDDKIELNRRMNETLESIARALFKSWFIDFDPVRAKMEGRVPYGMDAETATLFPDSFEDSPLGKIPKGWSVVPFSDYLEILSGGTPKTTIAEYWGGSIPWVSVVDTVPGPYITETEKTITEAGVDNSATKILPKETVIITARGTVGNIALLVEPMAMNQSCYGLRGKKGIGQLLLFHQMREQVARFRINAHGSVFDTITRNTFDVIEVVQPLVELSEKFEAVVRPLFGLIANNQRQSKYLASIRDTLLPRLISGQLRVRDAEALAGEGST